MMVTKREKFYPLSSPLARSSTTSLDDLHSVELEASVWRERRRDSLCVCMYAYMCVYACYIATPLERDQRPEFR